MLLWQLTFYWIYESNYYHKPVQNILENAERTAAYILNGQTVTLAFFMMLHQHFQFDQNRLTFEKTELNNPKQDLNDWQEGGLSMQGQGETGWLLIKTRWLIEECGEGLVEK